MSKIYLLTCESSCDETAFTIYNLQSNLIIASIINSQISLHEKNGGVIPELASQYHYSIIDTLFTAILKKANLSITDIDYFAATAGPGLTGALLIGFTFIKAIAWSLKKPFIPINHLEGHIFSPFLSNATISFPHLCLSVSGGHSTIYLVTDFLQYKKLGETRDDACGECFDKIAKLLHLPYPGGKYIEEITNENNYENKRNYPISVMEDGSISFSGLKTAVLYDIMRNDHYDSIEKKINSSTPIEFINEVACSAQYTITHMLEYWLMHHIKNHSIKAVTLVGGVACNEIIKKQLSIMCVKLGITFLTPEKKYCCDNADMISYIAMLKIANNTIDYNNYTQGIFNAIN
jgi:N6-L-threonylcarbamoyladenine synthase